MTREYSSALIEIVEEGIIDKDMLIKCLVKYMSEDEVRDCMHINGILYLEEEVE
jgi:hypothetical protein|tara:strand:+ start:191 stop:352 length:162 start_codon:yes stop_codon:yes gene_type:complete